MPKPDIRDDPTYRKILALLKQTDEAELKWIFIFIEAYLRNK